MKISFPSPEFDDAVAAVCHDTASEECLLGLGELLRADATARDAYLHRLALHAHLASNPDLFAAPAANVASDCSSLNAPERRAGKPREKSSFLAWPVRLALAAGLVLLLGVASWIGWGRDSRRQGETSRAVAMLNRVVNAQWSGADQVPRLGAPLEPGTLRLASGLAQVVFYNGARVVMEGPAELRLVSSSEAACVRGTMTAEVPPPARGFRVTSSNLAVTDLGTAFGLKVQGDRAELHVFEGRVEYRTPTFPRGQTLTEGKGTVVEGTGSSQFIRADPAAFASLFDLQAKSVAAEARRYDQWRESVRRLQRDPSLWVHFDFEHGGAPAWRLANSGSLGPVAPDATIVGCEWSEGRWATKPALEFRGISDRVRLDVPDSLDSVTLAAWVRVQGLDRQINSLFMSDGFLPGTLHWVIRQDGVLGLTAIGDNGAHQIIASPPVLTIDQFGIWTHLAVVLDARARHVVHYLNGRPVSRHALRIAPPFRVGTAELGNWNAHGFSGPDPFLVRNFSGAMDEFCLFNRALGPDELGALYAEGRPQAESLAAR